MQVSDLFPGVADVEVLLVTMKTLGAIEVTASYSGSGDSGQIDDIMLSNGSQAIDISDIVVMASPVTHEMVEVNTTWRTVKTVKGEPVETPLRDVLESACYAAIDAAGHSGWENNDGAEGTLTIDLTKTPPTFTLMHTEFYQESNDHEYTFEYDVGPDIDETQPCTPFITPTPV